MTSKLNKGESPAETPKDLIADRDSWRRVCERLQREARPLCERHKSLISTLFNNDYCFACEITQLRAENEQLRDALREIEDKYKAKAHRDGSTGEMVWDMLRDLAIAKEALR